MRVVVTGATGNVGTSVVNALTGDPRVSEIVGIARRRPDWSPPRTRWVAADVARASLAEHFDGADAVIHLAWLIQPSRDEQTLEEVNVHGSRRVFEAAAAAGVGTLVHASSVGVYSPGPASGEPVDESWPAQGIPSSFYSRHKAAAERILDGIEVADPRMRVVRLRPALIFKRDAASEIRRLFAGPLLPGRLAHPGLIPVLPLPRGLRTQAVHGADVAEAYRLVATDERARGAYNVAADPILDAESLGAAFDARTVPLPVSAVRAAADLSWRLRLQPTPPGWLDLGMQSPLLDTSRIRDELGWRAAVSADSALLDLMGGMRVAAGGPTPPLDARAGGPLRVREFLSGVGARTP
jgi:UDP-glucose 4-epimerase